MKGLICALSFLFIVHLSLQTFVQYQKLTGSTLDSYYGFAIALSENKLVITNYGVRVNRGNAYIYETNGGNYSIEATTNNPSTSIYTHYGNYAAIEGDTVAIAAIGEFQGVVYIYNCSGPDCVLTQTLSAVSGTTFDSFGSAMDFQGNMLAIGAYGSNNNTGAVYIFTFDGSSWVQRYAIPSPYPIGSRFGYSLALSSNTLVVTAPYNSSGPGFAAVYTVTETNFTFEQSLPNDATANAAFGNAVAFDGSTIAVGAFWNSIGNVSQVGTVYVYVQNRGVWTLQQKLYPQSYSAGFLFGSSIAIYQNTLIVGAFPENTVYVFTGFGSTWVLTQTIISSDYPKYARSFGTNVALNANTLVVADPLYNPAPPSLGILGAVYIFHSTSEIQTTEVQTTARSVCGKVLN